MIKQLIIILLLCSINSFAQTIYTKDNAWLAVNGQINTGKYRFVLDGGHRNFDSFFKKSRTSLIRFSAAYKIRSGIFLGLGFANFYHYTYLNDETIIQNEVRPFLQAHYFKKTDKVNLTFRFRNEFRYWIKNSMHKNRSRLQILYAKYFNKKLKFPVLQYETFVTPGKAFLYEQRAQIGFQYELNQFFSIWPYCMIQLQSNNPYLQKIIGLTINYNRTHGS